MKQNKQPVRQAVYVELPAELVAALDKEAKQVHRSRTGHLIEILRERYIQAQSHANVVTN